MVHAEGGADVLCASSQTAPSNLQDDILTGTAVRMFQGFSDQRSAFAGTSGAAAAASAANSAAAAASSAASAAAAAGSSAGEYSQTFHVRQSWVASDRSTLLNSVYLKTMFDGSMSSKLSHTVPVLAACSNRSCKFAPCRCMAFACIHDDTQTLCCCMWDRLFCVSTRAVAL